jgi:hypothetical protein
MRISQVLMASDSLRYVGGIAGFERIRKLWYIAVTCNGRCKKKQGPMTLHSVSERI